MQYLKISNPGVADPRCFTLLGVSTSRGDDSKVGQFGTGFKMGTLLLLRENISPIVYVGNLKLEFSFKPIDVDGKEFRQVIVNISGKDQNGKQVKRTEDLSYTLEHGSLDWRNVHSGLKEYVSNCLDGSIENTGNYRSATVEIVGDMMRAKSGYTQIYIPLTSEVKNFFDNLGTYFLHFNKQFTPKTSVMVKDKAGPAKIYYRGVIVRCISEMSVFDYNVSNLHIDEARQSDEWSCRTAVAETLCRKENKQYLKQVLRETIKNKDLFESTISQYTWSCYKEAIADAYTEEFGNDAVLVSEVTVSHVSKKGFIPVMLNDGFASVLRTVERLKTDSKVLDHAECQGYSVLAATDLIIKEVDKVWDTFNYLGLTNNRNKPEVKCMFSAMDGECKTQGMYKNNVVYIDQNLGGVELTQTVVEELCHHITQSGDLSRDIQDHAFLTIAKMIS